MCEFIGHNREISPYRTFQFMQGDDAQHLYKACNISQQCFQRLMSHVMSPVWMQVCRFPTCSDTHCLRSSSCSHSTKTSSLRPSCHNLRDCWVPSNPKIFSIRSEHLAAPELREWLSFPVQQLHCCWWVSAKGTLLLEMGSVKSHHTLMGLPALPNVFSWRQKLTANLPCGLTPLESTDLLPARTAPSSRNIPAVRRQGCKSPQIHSWRPCRLPSDCLCKHCS